MSGRPIPLSRAILLAALPLLGWWLTGLFDLDEGFYGAVVAEMNRRHEWVTPYYNGQPWFEKPILLYWLAKPTMALFGSDFGARLPSVLCSLATIAIVGFWGEKRLRPGAGALAALVLGSSLLPVALGRMMMTDPPLVLCMTVAFLGYWEAMRRPWCLVGVGAALGFGVLAKGPVALLLFVPAMIYLAVRNREALLSLALAPTLLLCLVLPGIPIHLASPGWTEVASLLKTLLAFAILLAIGLSLAKKFGPCEVRRFVLPWLSSLFCLVVVVAAWYFPAYIANGQTFVQKFLIEQNLGRFTGGDAAHTLGFATLPVFIPIVLLGMAPWSWWLWDAWRNRSDEDHRRGYLWAWALTVFLFFSLSGAKLIHYVLPLFPPLALLVADRLTLKPWALRLAVRMVVFMALFANAGFLVWYRVSGQEEAHRLVRLAARFPDGRPVPEVALYQIGRREASRGTGGTRLMETSLPSLTMVLDRAPVVIEEPSGIQKLPAGSRVFTRTGRIADPALLDLSEVGRGENYVVYRKGSLSEQLRTAP